mmetsp:Transcript_26598/g.58397  ORF Transcript_26598/g.58397 Transcript_26598/m.58397 type:complete len:325 (-) Transcript_26598:150-1124(-)
MRPASGGSTRSRRDEVWEIKRQRWLARQHSAGNASCGDYGARGDRAVPLFGDPPRCADEAAPSSPLSRLVARGYPASEQIATAHQPYGERPSSRHQQASPHGSMGSAGGSRSSSVPTGGFHSGVAGQWSANVQRDVQQRQNRMDPSIAGPTRPSGGQRITQAPGGGASIDLSWNTGQAQSSHPPRMPTTSSSSQAAAANGGSYGSAQPAPAANMDSYSGAGSYRRQEMRGASPSHAARGMNGRAAAPFGRDDDPVCRAPPQRRDAAPLGAEMGLPGYAGGRAAARGLSPHCGSYGADAPAAGAIAARGRVAGRPPGGASSLVLG